MKITSILLSAILAAASVDAAATAESDPSPEAVHQFCYRIGEPCSKLKRAAEALAIVNAEPAADAEADAVSHYCNRSGGPCAKARRDALALAEAVADAHASALPAPDAGKLTKPPPHGSFNY